MDKMNKADLPFFAGYEYTGEFRVPNPGEYFLSMRNDDVLEYTGSWLCPDPRYPDPRYILRKEEPSADERMIHERKNVRNRIRDCETQIEALQTTMRESRALLRRIGE